MKNKLFILKKDEEIIAISEYKKYIFKYMLQNNLNNNNLSLLIIDDKKSFNKYIIKYDSYLLDEFEDMIITGKEKRLIYKYYDEEVCRIETMIDDLKYIVNNYNMKSYKKDILYNSIIILKKLLKPNKLFKAVNLSNFLFDIRSIYKDKYQDFFNDIYTIHYFE